MLYQGKFVIFAVTARHSSLFLFVFFVFVLWPIEWTTTNGQGFKTYNKNFQKACFEGVSLVHSYYNILVLDKDVRLFNKLYWPFVNEYLLHFYWDRFLGRTDPYLNWPPCLIKLLLFLIKSITPFIWICCGSPVLLKTPCSFFELELEFFEVNLLMIKMVFFAFLWEFDCLNSVSFANIEFLFWENWFRFGKSLVFFWFWCWNISDDLLVLRLQQAYNTVCLIVYSFCRCFRQKTNH